MIMKTVKNGDGLAITSRSGIGSDINFILTLASTKKNQTTMPTQLADPHFFSPQILDHLLLWSGRLIKARSPPPILHPPLLSRQ